METGVSLPLILGCAWIFAATVTAFLPMRYQYPPGIALLIVAPFLIAWIGYVHGWLLTGAALFAFVSMFRNPLRYFWRRARGERPEIPT